MSCPTRYDIYEVLDEYKPDYGIMSETDENIRRLQRIVYERLDETDRRIILSYAELGNVRDTATLFKVSPTTIWLRIKRIRNKIKENLK